MFLQWYIYIYIDILFDDTLVQLLPYNEFYGVFFFWNYHTSKNIPSSLTEINTKIETPNEYLIKLKRVIYIFFSVGQGSILQKSFNDLIYYYLDYLVEVGSENFWN